VVCGHILCAEIRSFGGITYYNDGDWVESCTALTEDAHGAMAIVDWANEKAAEADARAEVEVPLEAGA
jgi:UDP-2,3-diacylglucosamine pyrophosphatase LpxH